MKEPQRETIKIHEETADDLILSDEPIDGFVLVHWAMVDKLRWEIIHELVVERLEDQTFWKGHWSQPATEKQEGTDRWRTDGDGNVTFTQVFPRVVTVTEYK